MTISHDTKTWWRYVLFAPKPIIFSVVFSLFLAKAIGTLDPDFGWHLRSGEYILAHGIPSHDIFTYTAPQYPWVHHEWLADVLSAMVYHIGGYWLLGLLFASLWTAAVWMVSRRNPFPILTLIAVCAMLSFSGVRALTWTVFSCAVLYLLLKKGGKILIGVPLLFLLWANMHGGFVLGLAYLGWKMLEKRSRILAIVLLGALCMTSITPYGVGIYTEIFQTLTDTDLHANIQEWNSFALTISSVMIIGIWAAARAVLTPTWWRAILSFESVLFAGTLSSIRTLPLFCLFALAWLTEVLLVKQTAAAAGVTQLISIWKVVSIATISLLFVMGSGIYDALQGGEYRCRKSLSTFNCSCTTRLPLFW